MTDQQKDVQEAQDQVRKVGETTELASSHVLEALEAVEHSLAEAQEALHRAIIKSKDAETVTKLLKGQVRTLREQLQRLETH